MFGVIVLKSKSVVMFLNSIHLAIVDVDSPSGIPDISKALLLELNCLA